MKVSAYITAFSLLLTSCGGEESTQMEQSTDGWYYLINDDLNAWSSRGTLNAEVTDGTLSLSAIENQPGALLISKVSYDNFHLEMEFKSADLASGILFRFNDLLKSTPEIAGYKLVIDADPNVLYPLGTIMGTARSTVPEGFDAGNWNLLQIKAIGSHLSVFVNDHKVAEANSRNHKTGKIGLQVPADPGHTVQFRNIRVMPQAGVALEAELLEDRFRSDTTVAWESIFDGTTLNGWNAIGDGNWEVDNGVLHGYSGTGGGFLVSEKTYRNFYLKTKFKIIKEDNSGIFIRKSPDSPAVTITDAIECNIYDHNGPSHAYSTGSIATHARAWFGMIDYQDWNTMEIFAHENQIVMYVNDQKSSECFLPEHFNKTGNICLQGGIKVFAEDQGPSNIYYKDIMIKNMD